LRDWQADDQRGKGKHAQHANEHHNQPNGPVAPGLDNLKG
jgi:hypothetical protein